MSGGAGQHFSSADVREVYVFTNRFGKVLLFYTEKFVAIAPEIAAKISPAPLHDRAAYDVGGEIDNYPDVKDMLAAGAVAGMFYPAKRDDVRTVFFEMDGRCFVKKTVGVRAGRRERYGFRQLEIPPTPLYKGLSVRELMAKGSKSVDDYERILVAFIDELMRQFPLLPNGNLPECTFDAIPHNCIVDTDGRYNFFDLEYEMIGGVPLAYMIERIVMATVPSLSRETGAQDCSYEIADRLASHYHVTLDWRGYERICRRNKLFNTRSPKRIAGNILLSLIPFRAIRERLRWWSSIPKLKAHVVKTSAR